jgi:hypothetical protein
MIKKITKYIKYYFEPCPKQLSKDAFESAQNYFANKSKSRKDFSDYQQAYIRAYRKTYAKNQLNTI